MSDDPDLLNSTSPSVLVIPGHSLRYNPAPDAGSAASRNRTEPTAHFNGTGYYVENDDVDNSFTDVQTLFLACFATLVPLVFSLLTAFAVRILWRKYRRNRDCRSYDGVLHQEDSTDRLSGHSSGAPLHAHLLNSDKNTEESHEIFEIPHLKNPRGTARDQQSESNSIINRDLPDLLRNEKVKTCESQFSITADEIECTGSPVLYSGSSSRTNHASANGSIITMTLKNNHLIVETEERNDIVEDSRETTMKYSPSLQDGVFVVEVQQGMRREGAAPGGYTATSDDATDQRALVHNPPERFNDEDKLEEVDEEYYAETTSPKSSPRKLKSSSTNTGLSQSTLSVTSGDPNPGYRYGNQQGYDMGYHGYPIYNGYINDDPIPRLPDNKPKITSAVYKQNGRLMSMASIDPEGGLSSDKYAKQQPSSEPEPEDAIQEEQRRLGNTPNEAPAIYNQIKQTIIASVSPKFEKLQNDLSPNVDKDSTAANGKYENKGYETTEVKK